MNGKTAKLVISDAVCFLSAQQKIDELRTLLILYMKKPPEANASEGIFD